MNKSIFYIICTVLVFGFSAISQAQEDHVFTHSEEDLRELLKAEEESYNQKVLHHIADANHFHIIGDISLPLPVILYDFKEGFTFCMSNAFEHGHKAVDGYVMNNGNIERVLSEDFPEETVSVDGFHEMTIKDEDGKDKLADFVVYEGKSYRIQGSATLLGLREATFIDFSITKNVFTMLLAALLLIWIFLSVRKGYRKNDGKAPTGIQSFMEPFILFVRDEIAIPAIGKGWEKYFPFIATLFFFILICNILGIVPFFPGSANIMGNVGATLALALIVFLVTNFSANRHYWQHIFWMPGVPIAVRPILAIIEFLGLFTKPFTLFIRIFGNIAAGHIIILSLVGLIFILGQNGESIPGIVEGSIIAVPFVFAMNLLELFVGALQAFIFALLAALYIGDATAEAH